MSEIEHLRAKALTHGYRLIRIRPSEAETIEAVRQGHLTAGDVASHLGIERVAAAMRLRRAWEGGLLNRDDRGVIYVYRPKE